MHDVSGQAADLPTVPEERVPQDPVYWDDDLQTWFVTGHEEAREALTDPALSSQWLSGPLFNHLDTPVMRHVRQWLMWMDPPLHKEQRSRLSSLFTARTVGARSTEIRERVRGAYAGFVGRGGGDVVEDLALPLISGLISGIIGLEQVDRATLLKWPGAAGALMARPYHRGAVAEADHILTLLAEEVDSVVPRLQGTVVGRTSDSERGAPGDTVLHLASLFTFAGIETTAQALTRLIDLYCDGTFGDRPDAEDMVRELLRYDTPVPQVPRIVTRRTRLGGHTVEPDQMVLVVLASANHDPRVFDAPGDVCPHRGGGRTPQHLAYGHGRHRCIGAPLANAVLHALAEELTRCPAPSRADATQWHQHRGYRGIARLDVTYPTRGDL